MLRTQIKSITLSILLLAGAMFGMAAPISAAERTIEITKDADYFGFDLRTEENVSLDGCKQICIADKGCKAFTYNTRAKWCFLKSDYKTINTFAGAVAGKIVEAAAEPDLGAAPPLKFLNDYQLSEALRYRNGLSAQAGQSGMTVDALLGIARNQVIANTVDQAMATYKSALTLSPDDSDLWREAATASTHLKDNWDVSNQGLNAAINAYQTSRTTSQRAGALEIMARTLENTQNYRAGINAYKASLALVDDPRVKTAYEDLRFRQGFRVVNNTIDNDSSNPRACIQFSEPLVKSGVDYTSFITLDGAAPKAIDAKDSEICVEGLVHGDRYKISLRAGLPSSVDEPLLSTVDLDIYVRDRTPSVRFTGDSFVLPSTARRGIPLVSINSDNADLKLYRVGDRGITQLLSNSQFLTQVDGYNATRIQDEQGELVWQGSIDIVNELNKDVVTSFPVDEALPDRKPGVYVLTAVSKQAHGNEWDTMATQWFVVSDLGISTYAGTDGLNVFVRSLSSAKPVANVNLQLLAKNNEVLGTVTTDADGRAKFSAGLMRGTSGMTPGVMTATNGKDDFVFLDMTRAGFDLSDRGVTGREAPGAVDILAWTERGIYRAGETVHVSALSRDITGKAIDKLPLTFVFLRPDGVEDRRIVSASDHLGGHTFDLPLQENAMRGSWTLQVKTDPKEVAIAEKSFLVDDFVPDRTEFDLTSKDTSVSPGRPATINVDGRYLYGAPAVGLELEGEVVIKPTHEREAFPGYEFGLADEEAQEETRVPLENLDPLDEQGKGAIQVELTDLPSTTQFLDANISVRMSEAGGRAIERQLTLPIRPDGDMIGIKAQFDGEVQENSNAAFSIIGVNPDGQRTAMTGVTWKILQLETNYQWYRDGSSWRYETVSTSHQIATGNIDVTKDGANITVPVTWGRFRLEVESADAAGPASSVEFNAGWYVATTSTETPDGLEMALDKENYKIGDVAKLSVSPRFAGEILINIGTESVISTQTATIPKEGGVVEIPVTNAFGSGAYVTATLFRPGEAQETRMPMRAIGVKWLTVDPGDNKLAIDLTAPEKTLPRQPLSIDVAVKGAGIGEEAWVTVAAVDVGILNLTNYTAPDPDGFYFGQRKLGLEIRDLYGRLIDGSLGAMGRLRTGGDGAETALAGSPPTEKLVAFFSGPVQLDGEGKAKISFDIPQFNGTARLMAVAWSRLGVGHATKDVIIRDPVVVTASMPKFLSPDDAAQLRIDLANTDGKAGDYTLLVDGNEQVVIDPSLAEKTFAMEPGGKESIIIPIKGGVPGQGVISLTLAGPDGLKLEQTRDLPVRPSVAPVTERRLVRLEPGRSLTLDDQLLADSIMQGASVSINMTQSPAFDVPALLMSLDRYPYGCAEQTTSRALPLLYLSELSAQEGMAEDAATHQRVQDAIYRVLSYQSSSGSFGLWSPGSGDLWLDAYVSDFLTRAREQKFDVPDTAMVAALDNLQNTLGYDSNVAERGNEMAYATYVLARNRKAAISDIRYFADTMIDQFPTPLAKAHIAAALSLYGDVERSDRIFASALSMSSMLVNVSLNRSDYGSALRDDAAVLALASESRPQPKIVPDLTRMVANEWEHTTYTSTQEQTWLLLAARALKDADSNIRVSVNDVLKSGQYSERFDGEKLIGNGLKITNKANDPVTAVITSVASPRQPLAAGGDGFDITRTYYNLDGEEVNASEVTQNERYVVVLSVKVKNAIQTRLMVSDLLPAGFEIDNPSLVNSANLSEFSWLPETEPAHVEYRYDRFLAAFDHASGDGSDYTMAYVVRAVTPGVYAAPAASVEDMYRPQLSARTATGKMEVFAPGTQPNPDEGQDNTDGQQDDGQQDDGQQDDGEAQ